MAVIINNEQDKLEVLPQWEETIAQVAKRCLQKEGIEDEVEIGVTFTDNEGIREINREYRNIDSATDVLSFPMYEADEALVDEDVILFGDIVISLERAQEQSVEFGHSLEREVMYLLVHGLLHLSGYDHMNDDDKKVMRRKEEELLTEIGAIR